MVGLDNEKRLNSTESQSACPVYDWLMSDARRADID